MSSYGSIDLLIMGLPLLIAVLKHLKLKHQKDAKIRLADGTIQHVDVEVKDPNNRSVGFQKQKDGSYKIIADCSGLTGTEQKKQTGFINTIKKRYAYLAITEQLKKQGYTIVEEKKTQNNSVKLTARRWVA